MMGGADKEGNKLLMKKSTEYVKNTRENMTSDSGIDTTGRVNGLFSVVDKVITFFSQYYT